jgi:hypothetical protein
MTIAVTVLGASGGASIGGALGMGFFCGIWGGLGFGCMMGATAAVARCQDREAEFEAANRQHVRTYSPIDERQPRTASLDATVDAA